MGTQVTEKSKEKVKNHGKVVFWEPITSVYPVEGVKSFVKSCDMSWERAEN